MRKLLILPISSTPFPFIEHTHFYRTHFNTFSFYRTNFNAISLRTCFKTFSFYRTHFNTFSFYKTHFNIFSFHRTHIKTFSFYRTHFNIFSCPTLFSKVHWPFQTQPTWNDRFLWWNWWGWVFQSLLANGYNAQAFAVPPFVGECQSDIWNERGKINW